MNTIVFDRHVVRLAPVTSDVDAVLAAMVDVVAAHYAIYRTGQLNAVAIVTVADSGFAILPRAASREIRGNRVVLDREAIHAVDRESAEHTMVVFDDTVANYEIMDPTAGA